MLGFGRGILPAIAALVLCIAGPAGAQENLDAGKTPAQLFASDCAICHKTTQGLSKPGGLFGLQGFLREHYTASKETAAAIAGYVRATDKGPPPAKHSRKSKSKRTPKGEAKAKADEKKLEKKPQAGKSNEAKASKPKAGEEKTSKPKPAEAKAGDVKPGAKPESVPGDSKPSKSESSEKKDSKPAEAKAGGRQIRRQEEVRLERVTKNQSDSELRLASARLASINIRSIARK